MPVPSYPSDAEARHDEGFLNSADHLRLYWQRYTPPKARATVAVIHGGGDHSGRYPALTSALVKAGFQAALVDLRGHGQSDGRRWHVDAFSDYLADLDAFVAKLSQDGVAGERLFVIAHSMGALVTALWGLTRGRHVSGFVFSSPYFRLATKPPAAKLIGARVLGRAIPWLPLSTNLDPADLTSDPELRRWTERDPLYGRATTPRWFDESSRAQIEVLRRAGEWKPPLLVLAGGADRIADVTAARAFVDAASAADKRIVVYDGFRHEIFNEVEREKPISEAIAWLTTRSGP
ncbi:alpha/beta hydrolase [Anaeromyxobacter oryzae]|uniref:Lysophospholipase n=1 Tax=Anaeromyxobacter oryzae TaxID=2918170 RepID=A0ABN6MN24_9BACT|nr:alpha/beta hydrolase [Anaeromyxobacter oryzae]BDG02447.1 lysophospholipase [Anaeromyxobacter oryzae]